MAWISIYKVVLAITIKKGRFGVLFVAYYVRPSFDAYKRKKAHFIEIKWASIREGKSQNYIHLLFISGLANQNSG
jgi:hypothetical protein